MKSRYIAAILAFFFGGIGAHKFYLGKTGQGILYLIFVWTGVPAILGIADGIFYILIYGQKEFDAKYNSGKKKSYTGYSTPYPHILPDKPSQSNSQQLDFLSATEKMAEFNKNRTTSFNKAGKI